jgi:hypothetical protein
MAAMTNALVAFLALWGVCAAEDFGPETCGKDRTLLANWFREHGSPSLLLNPQPPLFRVLDPNPYSDPSNPPPRDTDASFCGMKWSDTEVDTVSGKKKYHLKNFASEAAARTANYKITHKGHCGACSTLQDLGVYMGQNLTVPVRSCGSRGFFSHSLERQCLVDIGFTDECISIWQPNMHNTANKCFWVCMASWATGEALNKPDGSLNDCIQCDEDKSGPNFKYFSGRTRRNSGIPSAIQRPSEQNYPMQHCYCPHTSTCKNT